MPTEQRNQTSNDRTDHHSVKYIHPEIKNPIYTEDALGDKHKDSTQKYCIQLTPTEKYEAAKWGAEHYQKAL